MTLLGTKLATAQPAAVVPGTLLALVRAGAPRGEQVMLPVLGRAWIELAGHDAVNEIEGATFAEMARLKLAPTVLSSWSYEAERTARTLAWAVRDPSSTSTRFGSLEEWLTLDSDLINACGIVYSDVRERLDPMGLPTLTDDDVTEIRLAIEKKNPMALRLHGVAKLSLYLVTTAAPPASSPIPPSSPGESSPEP